MTSDELKQGDAVETLLNTVEEDDDDDFEEDEDEDE